MKITDNGKENSILTESKLNDNVALNFNGNNNVVNISKSVNISQAEIFINGDNNILTIGSNFRAGNLRIIIENSSELIFGDKTTVEQAYFLSRDNCKIKIGEDCMISFQCDFRTSDAHGIYDLSTGDLINKPGDIILKNHIWVGQGCWISKNTTILKNSIIGAKSMIQNVLIPENVIYAGSPGKLIKENVVWTRDIREKLIE